MIYYTGLSPYDLHTYLSPYPYLSYPYRNPYSYLFPSLVAYLGLDPALYLGSLVRQVASTWYHGMICHTLENGGCSLFLSLIFPRRLYGYFGEIYEVQGSGSGPY